jgi:ABC-type transport system involved in multi-copper enzyme maturation permease subunit
LFVGTLSFKPLSAQKALGQFFFNDQGMPMIFLALNNHKPEQLEKEALGSTLEELNQYRLTAVEVLTGESDSPESDYLLTVSQARPVAKGDDNQDNLQANIDGVRKVFHDAETLGFVRIGAIELIPAEKNDGSPRSYRVTLHSTPRTHRIWAAEPNLLFGAFPMEMLSAPVAYQLYVLTSIVLSFGQWVAVLVGVIVTSFFIPNMLRKGTIDMLLVKPIHRWVLLLYKYVGGLTFIFISTAYAIGGMWLVLGIRTGLWANAALLLILTITFFFAILYAISTFIGVLTRSTVSAIMVTIIAWFLFFAIGSAHKVFHDRYLFEKSQAEKLRPIPEEKRWGDNRAAQTLAAAHAITPRTSDLNYLNDLTIYCGFMTGSVADIHHFDSGKLNWWESLGVSGAWIAFFLGLSCLWFTYKDY